MAYKSIILIVLLMVIKKFTSDFFCGYGDLVCVFFSIIIYAPILVLILFWLHYLYRWWKDRGGGESVVGKKIKK